MEQNKSKKIMISITIIIGIVLILCTFLSKTIYSMSLPYVEITKPVWGELPIDLNSEGEIVIEDEQAISYNVPLEIIAVHVDENSIVKKGDLLFEVEYKEFELEVKRKELAIQDIDDQFSEWHNSKQLQRLNTELEIATLDLEVYQQQTPYNGKIVAKKDGIVTKISVTAGDQTEERDVLAKISSENQNLSVKFNLSDAEGALCNVGDMVDLTYTETEWVSSNISEKEKTDSCAITKKEYDSEKQEYLFYADISSGSKIFHEGEKIKVKLLLSSNAYDNIVPLNALSEDGKGNVIVYVLKTRDGLFGKESYVEECVVNQIQKNSINTVILAGEINEYSDVIVSSSKPLTSGEIVRVVE